jgi:hypothetical protein
MILQLKKKKNKNIMKKNIVVLIYKNKRKIGLQNRE